MKEEYLEIEELDFNNTPYDDEQHHEQTRRQQQQPTQEQYQTDCMAAATNTQPHDFDVHNDEVMLKKLLKKFQMNFLYPFLKVSDITYRSLRYLSTDDINAAIRSVGHRAEFREKLFTWRRKRYRTNDIIIECEKYVPPSTTTEVFVNTSLPPSSCNNVATQTPPALAPATTITTQTAVVMPEISTPATSSNNFHSIIKPYKREASYLDSSSLQDIINDLPIEIEYEMETKRPKLLETTVELRETRLSVQLNLEDLLDSSLFGPVMKAFYEKNGYLERKHRDELIQTIVDHVITNEIKLHCSDFTKIVDMIVCIFPMEEESRDYYFINRKGKRNPMGRLYTKYYNTLKRMRVRDIHQEFTQETTLMQTATLQDDAAITTTMMMNTIEEPAAATTRPATMSSTSSLRANSRNTSRTTTTALSMSMMSSNNSSSNSNNTATHHNHSNDANSNSNSNNSINTQIELIDNDYQELVQLDDTSVSAIKNFLRCQGLDWDDVKTMWSKTYLARQEDVEHSTIKDILQQWPKYLNARGMELFDIDFHLKFTRNKGNSLQQKWKSFVQKVYSYYQGNIKDEMCKGLFALSKSKPGKDTEDYIMTVLLNSIMLPMARYRDAVGNRRKISIVEAVDLFAIRVNALEELDQKREEFSIKYGDMHTDYTPLIVVVGDNNINIHEIYVHFDVALYEMPDFLSAIDCCMKIYRVLNLPYPASNEYSWTFIQRYFYEIFSNDDIKCPSMSSLITYLKF